MSQTLIQYPAMTNYNNLLDSLNDAQRIAVAAPLCHQLVLAGAGSGKTRVLVHRIAWLIQSEGLSPFNVLAVTFTNKAAQEMRSRIENFLGTSAKSMWVGTFHSLAHRLLRLHWREANLPEGFQILDADDQLRLIRRVMNALNLEEDRWPPRQAQWFINAKKDEGLEAQHLPDYGDITTRTMIQIYRHYTDMCQRSGLIDFADLLLKVHRLWITHSEILAHYQQRFRCILVDEFQDTNAIQYAWIRLLAGKDNYAMIVGDDDQSIYGWRGAKIENIQRFCRDFPTAITTRLEQNYRSTGIILKAANALIAHNADRLGKNLWTAGTEGERITVYAAFNDLDEARFIVNRVRDWQNKSNSLRHIAILYRSNAQSRVLEEALMQFSIAYRVYGGLRFFERAEIKDALAYLRLIANREDDAAFERIVNTPSRGIGERTIIALRECAQQQSIPLWRAAQALLQQQVFPARATHSLEKFLHVIETLASDTQDFALHEQTEHVIHNSGLIEHYRKEKGEKGLARIENLEELVNAARQFDGGDIAGEMSPLMAFLSYSALEAGENQAGVTEDGVQLMTLHSAKGLEFPIVFLCGCEEELFPHYMSLDDPKGLEEERRLCYVGMTRAMQKLYMTYAESRRIHGKEVYHRPSRFLAEIPPEYLQETRLKTKVSRPQSVPSAYPKTSASEEEGLRIGQPVRHHQFGEGVVLQYEGRGEHARIQVRFEKVGTKWLIASFVTA